MALMTASLDKLLPGMCAAVVLQSVSMAAAADAAPSKYIERVEGALSIAKSLGVSTRQEEPMPFVGFQGSSDYRFGGYGPYQVTAFFTAPPVLLSGASIAQSPGGISQSPGNCVGGFVRPDAALQAETELWNIKALEVGWDGEGAPAPDVASFDHALRFIRSIWQDHGDLTTSVHADGRIILEREYGSIYDEAIFNSDGSVALWSKNADGGAVSKIIAPENLLNEIFA